MLFFLLICGLASSEQIFEEGKELILVQALWRHGDRSPTGTYKNDYYQEPYWTFGGGGWGQLSPLGMTQHVNLGKMLRKRYVDETYKGYLSSYYNSKEVYYRSTDVNRTLISAMSNIVGMWSQPEYNNRVDTDYPNSPYWPTGFVPVPVHTVDDNTDFVGNVDAKCPRQDKLWAMAKTSKELVDFNTAPNMTSLLSYLTDQCGQDITIDNIDKVAGSFLIEKIHCPDFRQQNAFYTPSLDDQVTGVNDQMDLYKNGVFNQSPLMMNGLDIGLEIQKIRGGSMTNDIEMHMNIKLDCVAKNKTDGECAWISNLKYYVYSAHDTTVYAFFSCLGIQSKAVQPKGYPQYSAATLVELWYDHKEKQPYFKMLYHSADGQPFVPITSDIDGCDGDFCKLDVYHKISKRVTPDQPIAQWCLVDPTQSSTSLAGFTGMILAFLMSRLF